MNTHAKFCAITFVFCCGFMGIAMPMVFLGGGDIAIASENDETSVGTDLEDNETPVDVASENDEILVDAASEDNETPVDAEINSTNDALSIHSFDKLINDVHDKNVEIRDDVFNGTVKDFAGKDLSGSDFSNLEFQGVNFSECNLSNVNFSGSRFSKCNFRGARLQDVILDHAFFAYDVDFSYAIIKPKHADLCQFLLSNFSNVEFNNANLSQDVSFFSCNLSGADFTQANCTDVSFYKCCLDDVLFKKTILDNARIEGEGQTVSGITFDQASCMGTLFSNYTFRIGLFQNVIFGRVDFKQINFMCCYFLGCDLKHAKCNDSNLIDTCFKDCCCEYINFEKTRWTHTPLIAKNVKFNWANFKDCVLNGCEINKETTKRTPGLELFDKKIFWFFNKYFLSSNFPYRNANSLFDNCDFKGARFNGDEISHIVFKDSHNIEEIDPLGTAIQYSSILNNENFTNLEFLKDKGAKVYGKSSPQYDHIWVKNPEQPFFTRDRVINSTWAIGTAAATGAASGAAYVYFSNLFKKKEDDQASQEKEEKLNQMIVNKITEMLSKN